MVMALSATSLGLLLLVVLLTNLHLLQGENAQTQQGAQEKEVNPEFQDVDRKLMEISNV
uniref:Uncharacterized protein n=1 Tax=Anguilla anguilla TaxID=7936 RepID=A0A0E9PHC4_ANGAN